MLRAGGGGTEGMSATANRHTMGVMQEQGMENWHWEIVRHGLLGWKLYTMEALNELVSLNLECTQRPVNTQVSIP